MKIFIIEDDQAHWVYTKFMLDKMGIEYFPKELNDFAKLVKNINRFYSPDDEIREEAKEYLLEKVTQADFLLMDYVLNEGNRKVNCVDLYVELGLSKKALVYTRLTSKDLQRIIDDLKDKSLNKLIHAAQKPVNMPFEYERQETIDYLHNAIKAVTADRDDPAKLNSFL